VEKRLSVSSVWFRSISSLVRSGKNQPADSVGEFHLVEVDEQPDRNVEQLHVAQELSLVDRQDFLYSLCFHEHAAFHQDIEAQWLLAGEAFVFDQRHVLAHALQAPQPQLLEQEPTRRSIRSARGLCRDGPQWPQRWSFPSVPEPFSNNGCIRPQTGANRGNRVFRFLLRYLRFLLLSFRLGGRRTNY
jgi:hypothetical protein